MYEMTQEEFEGAVADAIDSIPDDLFEALDNVVFMVEDEPNEQQEGCEEGTYAPGGSDLLGIYDGLNLLQRGNGYGSVSDYPDTITIFKGPHERLEGGREEILEEVRKTVIHEVGHYFGMTEEQVAEMGYA